jgi:hypothetical protein
MASTVANAIRLLDSAGLAIELLGMEIEDRSSILSEGDMAGVLLFAARLTKDIRDFEAKLPRFKRPPPKRPGEAKYKSRGLDASINGEVKGRSR